MSARARPEQLVVAEAAGRGRHLVVIVMLAAIALDQAGEPAAAPAVAAAAGAFGIGLRATAWLSMSYGVGYLAATVVSVWAIVCFGTRPYLTLSLASCAVASLTCAMAVAPDVLLVARFAQGAAAGGIFTAALLTIVSSASKRELPIVMTIFAAVMLLAPTLAPLYAGIALQISTWRAVFAGFALAAAILALLANFSITAAHSPRAKVFDAITFAALALGILSFQFLIDQGAGVHWFAAPSTFVAVMVVGIALAVFAFRELRASPSPFLDLRVLESAVLARGLTTGVLLGMLLAAVGIEASYARVTFALGPIALGAFVAVRAIGIVLGVGLMQARSVKRVPPQVIASGGMIAVAGACLVQSAAIAHGASAAAHALIGIWQGAAFALVLGPLATILFGTVDRDGFAALAVLFKISVLVGSGLTLAIAATVATGARNVGVADIPLWIGAALLALLGAALTATLHVAIHDAEAPA